MTAALKEHVIARLLGLPARPQMSTAQPGKAGAAPAWLDWLERHGVETSAAAMILGVHPDTVRHWRAGDRKPDAASLRALRLLVAVLSIAPDLRHPLALDSDEDLGRKVDALQLRAVSPLDPDRTIAELLRQSGAKVRRDAAEGAQ